MAVSINGKTYQSGSLGFLLALLVIVGCFVLYITGKGANSWELAFIAALAVAYLVG